MCIGQTKLAGIEFPCVAHRCVDDSLATFAVWSLSGFGYDLLGLGFLERKMDKAYVFDDKSWDYLSQLVGVCESARRSYRLQSSQHVVMQTVVEATPG